MLLIKEILDIQNGKRKPEQRNPRIPCVYDFKSIVGSVGMLNDVGLGVQIIAIFFNDLENRVNNAAEPDIITMH